MSRQYRSHDSDRHELDVPIVFTVAIALGLTAAVYGALIPFEDSYLETLLAERGFTQYIAIFLAGMVVAFTLLKLFKLQWEMHTLRYNWLPTSFSLEYPQGDAVATLQQNLANSRSLLAVRCSRVLAAYMHSGTRKAAAELALDDASFYTTASESSYTFPRILVWAIPLMGFIGTVVGISDAVTGFSQFLQEAGEIERIKEGIAQVTTGLSVAFDTTLLALLLSVVVMVPLVLVERFEARLLLAIDVYINDRLLPRLNEPGEKIDDTIVHRAVNRAFDERLPNAEILVEPAETYARQAAKLLAEQFVVEVKKVRDVTEELLEQTAQLTEKLAGDRTQFLQAFEQQQQTSHQAMKTLVHQIQSTQQDLMAEMQAGNAQVSEGLSDRTRQLSDRLHQAATVLEQRIAALEHYAAQVSEVRELQQSLQHTLQTLTETAQLQKVLLGVQDQLAQLNPTLQQMQRPRKIVLFEQDT
ncbi:MAG: flagellar motor protein MotA [Coleofasciculaceae cyanobacterium SM2_3_26]|nr:flagellar motor protein MotA [Coleofasciculaceae cyanobacterium SM2_3_26]